MINDFLEFEVKYNLLDDSIFGFNYWGYLRAKVYKKICDKKAGVVEQKTPKKKGFSSKLASSIDKQNSSSVMGLIQNKVRFVDVLYLLRNLTFNHPLLHHKHYDYLIFPSTRRTLVDGKYFAYWTDDLADYLGKKCICAESLDATKHMRPYWTKKLLEIDVVDVKPVLTSKFVSKFQPKIVKILKSKAVDLEKYIDSYFNIDIGLDYLEKMLVSRYFWWKSKKKFYNKLIKNIRPKVIVQVVGYETNNMVINEVAKKKNIPVVELQHGTVSMNHIAYNYLSKSKKNYMPDYLFTFSDYWKNACRFPIGENNIISSGYPYFEKQMLINPKVDSNDGIIRILILSQPIYQKEIYEFVSELIDLLNESGKRFKIVYKLHPAEYSHPLDNWKKVVESGFEIINNSQVTLYSLFANSDIQIGVSSTAIFEGLAYNLNTFVINLDDSSSRMKDLIDSGFAILCDSPKDIISHIDDKLEKETGEFFFKGNALKNIVASLEKIKAEVENGK